MDRGGGSRASGPAGAGLLPPGRYPLAADRRHWPVEARDYWEERAGILEFQAGWPRAEAEREAEAMARRWWRAG